MQEEVEIFMKNLEIAKTNILERNQKVKALQDSFELDMEILGATAIEDQLQDKVPETIAFMREAGIKVWVLTGDKVETAINIGYSSRLLSTDMIIFHITHKNVKEIKVALKFAYDEVK